MTTVAKSTLKNGDSGPPSMLDELLAVESEIAEGEATAAAEARSVLDAVRADIDARSREAEGVLQHELAQLDARAVTNEAAAVAEIESDASRRAARYRALTAADVARLAAFVCDRLIGLPEATQ